MRNRSPHPQPPATPDSRSSGAIARVFGDLALQPYATAVYWIEESLQCKRADEVEGDRCYHDLKVIPGGVDAVVIGARPEIADSTMRQCAQLDFKHVWMHRGAGSVSATAAAYGRAQGISVIDGGCPLMFDPTAAGAHKVMCFVFTLMGNVPRRV